MSFFRRITQPMATTRPATISRSIAYNYADKPREMFDILMAYYEQNGLYDALYSALLAIGQQSENLKGIRNPANRVAEFYAAKLWPGQLPAALPIVTANDAIRDPIHQVWQWSNWGNQKQVFARWLAIFGNCFIKVAQTDTRVFFQLLDPRHLSNLVVDSRGIITATQFDTPIGDGETYTEIWDSYGLRTWTHNRGYGADVVKLGTPAIQQTYDEIGIDFVPIVQVKHRDVGSFLGAGAYQLSIDKIDEANRQASRLYDMLFVHNKNLWTLSANAVDKTGRPIPAPRLGADDTDTLEVGDNSVIRLPGNSRLDSLIPKINYADALAILVDYLRELEQDLPELAYYRIPEAGGNLSGRALRLMMTPAIDRVNESRGNAETGLARADAMALSMGENAGLWSGLGTYASGDFQHTFAARPVIPLTQIERAEIVRDLTQAGLPASSALRFAGFSDEEIAETLQEMADAQAAEQTSLALALVRAQRDFDQGE